MRSAKKPAKKKPVRSADVPATKGMLSEMERKLKHEVTSLRLEMGSKFKQVDASFAEVDARFDRVESKILDVKSDIQKVLAAVHDVRLLVEEQNARNIYVFDGYAAFLTVSIGSKKKNFKRAPT